MELILNKGINPLKRMKRLWGPCQFTVPRYSQEILLNSNKHNIKIKNSKPHNAVLVGYMAAMYFAQWDKLPEKSSCFPETSQVFYSITDLFVINLQ